VNSHTKELHLTCSNEAKKGKAKPANFWAGFIIYGVILSGFGNLTGLFTDKPNLTLKIQSQYGQLFNCMHF
jgi:hypothetical protein